MKKKYILNIHHRYISIRYGSFLFIYLNIIHIMGIPSATLVGLECNENIVCPNGTVCVAGSSFEPIQRCVKTPVCAGADAGNCPAFETSGALLCTWVDMNTECVTNKEIECREYNNRLGIHKCLSVDRCNEIVGQGMCSNSCVINHKSCNGRGTCISKSNNQFQCTCSDGWMGEKCTIVKDAICTEGVGDCGTFGDCIDNVCKCTNNWTGLQCEKPPSEDNTNNTNNTNSNNTGSGSSNSTNISKTKKDNDTDIIYIIVGIIAGLAFIGLIIIIISTRKKKKREKLAENLAVDNITTARYSNEDIRIPTPKQNIAVM